VYILLLCFWPADRMTSLRAPERNGSKYSPNVIWSFSVVQNYLNFAIFSNDLFARLRLWFCSTAWRQHMLKYYLRLFQDQPPKWLPIYPLCFNLLSFFFKNKKDAYEIALPCIRLCLSSCLHIPLNFGGFRDLWGLWDHLAVWACPPPPIFGFLIGPCRIKAE
jgi:hypothetical protein